MKTQNYIIYYTAFLLLSSSLMMGQNVGISATGIVPDNSAGLDVNFTNKGLLIPRVALTSITDNITIPSPATSLLVYNTGTGGLAPAGYYYNAGTSGSPNWVRLLPATGTGGAWLINGNAGTTAGTHFVGTTDAQDLVFKTNNTERMRILQSNGNIGIGTATPTEKLEVVGSVKIVDGTQGNYKHLVSDAAGKGSWQDPPSSVLSADGSLLITSSSNGTGTANAFYTNYVVLPKGVYFVTYYNCLVNNSANPSYFVQATVEASAGTISTTGSGFVNFEGSQMHHHYNTPPFVFKVVSATATVRFKVWHATGGTITDSYFPSLLTCTSFYYVRISD